MQKVGKQADRRLMVLLVARRAELESLEPYAAELFGIAFQQQLAEAEKRELEEVSRTFMTEAAPAPPPQKKRDIRVF